MTIAMFALNMDKRRTNYGFFSHNGFLIIAGLEESGVEIRVNLDDERARQMERDVGRSVKATELTRDALTLLAWALEQSALGRSILSVGPDGEDLQRLVMPTLMEAQRSGAARREEREGRSASAAGEAGSGKASVGAASAAATKKRAGAR